ncbi:SAF domain-containing protein [Plantactinospora sp. CA-290183]|uniref:SAF domain-containing protein n=1 Tax=Plantactinospora sp. CA-290183 TaxID=3240006 RepID=UPI003D902525
MSTTTSTRSLGRRTPLEDRPVVDPPGVRRRRSVPRLLGGALLVVLGAVAFGVIGLRADPGIDVLAMARPVTAGTQLGDADLRVARIVPDHALRVVRASERGTVVGRTAAVPLAAGSLLTADQLGAVTDPPPGQSVIAVDVKTGRAPAGLAPGASVLIVIVPQSGATDAPPQAPAVVRAVDLTDSSGITVVSLQMSAESAVRIASATGDVALVLQNPGR